MTIGNRVFDFLVDFTANFAAALLNHPVLDDAALNIVVKAVKRILKEPDLDEHIMAFGEEMTKNRNVIAHEAGHDFPSAAKNFVKGVVHIGNSEKMKDESDSDSSDDRIDDTASASDKSSEDGHEGVASPQEATAVNAKTSDKTPDHCDKKPRWLHPVHTIRHHR